MQKHVTFEHINLGPLKDVNVVLTSDQSDDRYRLSSSTETIRFKGSSNDGALLAVQQLRQDLAKLGLL